jgi:hypothetical protein
MTTMYSLKEITDLSFSGYNYTISDEILSTINMLCSHVGSSGVGSAVFKKNVQDMDSSVSSGDKGFKPKKRRGNKAMEVSSEEWESIRTFQTTKIEQKAGIDGDIDQIRLFLNKLTDKTFLDMREKIMEKLNAVCASTNNDTDLIKVGSMIYDIASANKFYSKIFADLFSELLTIYTWLQPIFEEKHQTIMSQYQNIQYCDPEKDYDLFCDMNKANEKRKAITTFFVNLALNGIVPKDSIVMLLRNLLGMVSEFVNIPEKKNEVDELTENVAILYNKDILDGVPNTGEYQINGKTIVETITSFAKCKAKDFVSLSNKAIFKFMDLVEM